ncbi:PDZ domain-containing protein [Terriglobus sp. RCC_193]|uniref:PDZ domain-containing protein n=1 Tax=Terriglobus sp. RCC_193 TaxID=3239218 RepID=UPI0035242DA2
MTSIAVLAQEPGTLGISVLQLYGEGQQNKRGVLILRAVEPGTAAADAGLTAGDIIVSVNGTSAEGHDAGELGRAGLSGVAGDTVRLTVAKVGHPLGEVTLKRRPYAPHLNPATDAFHYSIPGNWQMDLRYPFPLPWAPSIEHKGLEDLAFAPGFDNTNSPEYHSYLIVWWLEGSQKITSEGLEKDMLAYFRGLAEQRGRNNKFTPDPTKVAAKYQASEGQPNFGGEPAANFAGTVTLYDRHGEVITLQSEVITAFCPKTGNTAVFFSMSKAPRPAALWKQMDAVRDGFQCVRKH